MHPRSARLLAAYRRLADWADRLDQAPPFSRDARVATTLVRTWGAVRMASVAVASPLLAAWVAARATWNTSRTRRSVEAFPDLVEDLFAGRPPSGPLAPGGRDVRVGRAEAGARWFVASDLHRCMAGAMDWPESQGTKGLYRTALEHYAAEGWGLIENGDVEDFWLSGGSAYGVVYDAGRIVGHALPSAMRKGYLPAFYGDHLDRIVANNAALYTLVRERFASSGRYLRLVGNHDDPLGDPAVAARLGDHLPEVPVLDHLVLADGDHPVGLVTHGHQTDPWNLPAADALGKVMTWIASALLDAPWTAVRPGIPAVEESEAILEGTQPDRLMAVDGRLGVNRDLYTLDERDLLGACRRRWGRGGDGPGLEGGPYVLFGHTHVPLIEPLVPGAGADDPSARWVRYANSGSGVTWELVTGLEWDGSLDPRAPQLRLVAWRYGTEDEPGVIGLDGGRPVVRVELGRHPGTGTLGPSGDRTWAEAGSGRVER